MVREVYKEGICSLSPFAMEPTETRFHWYQTQELHLHSLGRKKKRKEWCAGLRRGFQPSDRKQRPDVAVWESNCVARSVDTPFFFNCFLPEQFSLLVGHVFLPHPVRVVHLSCDCSNAPLQVFHTHLSGCTLLGIDQIRSRMHLKGGAVVHPRSPGMGSLAVSYDEQTQD